MDFHRILHYQPGKFAKQVLIVACWLLAVLIGYLHFLAGPFVELHSFYLIPVVVVTWYVSVTAGVWMLVIGAGGWLVTDFLLKAQIDEYWQGLTSELIRSTVFMMVIFVLGQLKAALRRESRLARRDTLTQLANRRAFFETASAEINRAKRYGYPLTAMMLDLDNFKLVNDKLGHDAGDRLLCVVAGILSKNLRSSDLAGRLGGDEFAILLPETGSDAADAIARKLQKELLEAMAAHEWPVTFSIGVATYTVPPENVEALLKSADTLMYRVKQSGKNQVSCVTF